MKPGEDVEGWWYVADEEGYEVAGPLDCEQDCWDWIEAFGDRADPLAPEGR